MADRAVYSAVTNLESMLVDIPTFGIGMLGYAFMGKAHTHALKTLDYIYAPPPAHPRLVSIAGRNKDLVEAARQRYGYEKAVTDWRELIEDPDIQVIDNGGSNDVHAEPCIAAARAGKHVICEKPLARSAEEARRMLDAVRKAGVVHMCAFNYRFVPAISLARQLIRDGRLGQIYHFRGRYLQEWFMDPEEPVAWRLDAARAGVGAIGDQGSHVIDLARYLVGEIRTVYGKTKTFVEERPNQDGGRVRMELDDAFASILEFENGALGTLETTRFAKGYKNKEQIEVNGSKGSLLFDLERFNELEVYLPEEEEPRDAQGFRRVLVTEVAHPFVGAWWPVGHVIGWEHTFVHEFHCFFEAIVKGGTVTPDGADFEDGYRACAVTDAILESSRSGRKVDVRYGA